MSSKKELSRITIAITKADYKKLKAAAASLGKSMQEVVSESIEGFLCSSKIPNEKTLKVIADAQANKGLINAKDAEDLFKKLGI